MLTKGISTFHMAMDTPIIAFDEAFMGLDKKSAEHIIRQINYEFDVKNKNIDLVIICRFVEQKNKKNGKCSKVLR